MTHHDDDTGVVGPDLMLASQFFGALKRQVYPDGEHRLMFAILEDAVRRFMRNHGAKDRVKKTLFREAEQWIMSTDRTWFFSFENVCDVLGLDPDYLRQGLLEWRKAQLQREDGEPDADGAQSTEERTVA